jgi:hypothetical protein
MVPEFHGRPRSIFKRIRLHEGRRHYVPKRQFRFPSPGFGRACFSHWRVERACHPPSLKQPSGDQNRKMRRRNALILGQFCANWAVLGQLWALLGHLVFILKGLDRSVSTPLAKNSESVLFKKGRLDEDFG